MDLRTKSEWDDGLVTVCAHREDGAGHHCGADRGTRPPTDG
jgi:hypothetical protein